MKLRYLTFLITSLLATSAIAEEAAKPATPPPTAHESPKPEAAKPAAPQPVSKDKLSYSIGSSIGKNLKQQGIEVNLDILSTGIKDMLTDNKKPMMTEQEISETMMAFQKEQMTKQMEKRKQEGEKNLKEGEKFLADNKAKEGVITTASGLQYKVLTPGKEGGKMPKAGDKVTTHYRGTLLDGTEFDSSIARGTPATFPVSGVIPGWTEALQLMKEGAKFQLVIPAKLAYGEQGAGGKIAPNSTLIFEVELISVQDAAAEKPPEAATDKKVEKKDAPADKPADKKDAPADKTTDKK